MSRDKLVGILARFGCYEPPALQPKPQPQPNHQHETTRLSTIPPNQPEGNISGNTPVRVLMVDDNKISRVSVYYRKFGLNVRSFKTLK